MAKKAAKRVADKKATKTSKAAPRPAAKAAKKAPVKAAAQRPAAPTSAPASAGPGLSERAERLRDEILRSKLTHPDPWAYAAKARAWGDRAQSLLEMIVVRGDTAAVRATFEALDAELQRDRDFQEARRLF